MYPNPQAALPLTARPNREYYRKLAKDLVRACRSDDPQAIRAWAAGWIERLGVKSRDAVADVETYARAHLTKAGCALTAAQFLVARAHGFLSWPTFAKHIQSLGQPGSPEYTYEKAVEAIVEGNAETLARLLRQHPGLVRARSTREHRATLLHYVSANGVEGYRQKSPQNAAAITRILLDAGADVDATTDVYEGKCTALGLVATSAPPAAAGVQRDVIDVLLEYGASMDRRGSVGRRDLLVRGCLANGQPAAAEHLAIRGAPLDLAGAAGLGRVDALRPLVPRASRKALVDAFMYACAYGQPATVDFLIADGVDVDATLESPWHGVGHTGLHVAAFHGQLEAVKILLRHHARVDLVDETWKTPPLVWALTGWRKSGHAGQYHEVVEALVDAGASVTPNLVRWAQADPKMMKALRTSR